MTDDNAAYLAAEAKARVEIDKQLKAAGWVVQSQNAVNVAAGPGVAVREFTLEKPHGRVDYLLFLNGQPAGIIEAKPEGTTLTEVEQVGFKRLNYRELALGHSYSSPPTRAKTLTRSCGGCTKPTGVSRRTSSYLPGSVSS